MELIRNAWSASSPFAPSLRSKGRLRSRQLSAECCALPRISASTLRRLLGHVYSPSQPDLARNLPSAASAARISSEPLPPPPPPLALPPPLLGGGGAGAFTANTCVTLLLALLASTAFDSTIAVVTNEPSDVVAAVVTAIVADASRATELSSHVTVSAAVVHTAPVDALTLTFVADSMAEGRRDPFGSSPVSGVAVSDSSGSMPMWRTPLP